jgi:hypothetical protein
MMMVIVVMHDVLLLLLLLPVTFHLSCLLSNISVLLSRLFMAITLQGKSV